MRLKKLVNYNNTSRLLLFAFIIAIINFLALFLYKNDPSHQATQIKFAKRNKYGYVALAGDESDKTILASIVWANSLRNVKSRYDLILLATPNAALKISNRSESIYFSSIISVPPIPNKYKKIGFTKLWAWTLEEYDWLIYMDIDIIATRNIDHLFDQNQPFAAVPDVYASHTFNSGVMLFKPNNRTFKEMVSLVNLLPSYNSGDQGFLNSYFSGWFLSPAEHRLPFAYNTIIYFPNHYNLPVWWNQNTTDFLLSDAHVIHFANPWFKPWNQLANSTDPLVRYWWKLARGVVDTIIMENHSKDTGFEADHLMVPMTVSFHAEVPIRDKDKIQNVKEGYVTYIDGPVAPVISWVHSLKSHGTKRDLILMVGPSVPASEVSLISKLFKLVIQVTVPKNRANDSSFGILNIWSLVKYTKLVYVDPNSLFFVNVDELFWYSPFAACPAVFPPDKFSIGTFVVRPSNLLFRKLTDLAKIYSPVLSSNVEGFLNSFFHDWYSSPSVHRIPARYNADVWFKSNNMISYFEPVSIIRFDERCSPAIHTEINWQGKRKMYVKIWKEYYCKELIGEINSDCIKKSSEPT